MQNILQNLACVQGGTPPEGGPNSVECSAYPFHLFHHLPTTFSTIFSTTFSTKFCHFTIRWHVGITIFHCLSTDQTPWQAMCFL